MDMSLNCNINCVYTNKIVDNVMIIVCQQAFTVQPIERYNLPRIRDVATIDSLVRNATLL